jgi:hypothetical protein
MWACCQWVGSVTLAPWCSSPSPASPILMYTKSFLLAGPSCRGWHKDCFARWGIIRDGKVRKRCVLDRLTRQHHGLCFDDHGAEGPWDTRTVVGKTAAPDRGVSIERRVGQRTPCRESL